LNVLEQYLKQQVADQRNTVTASDWLPRLFSQSNAFVACARDGGLLALAAMPTARRLFARHAMGQGQRAARIG
jgi:2-polyprenyl-6-methoxyphenol hydroxylase-like FAD-dependent oxidoreductase